MLRADPPYQDEDPEGTSFYFKPSAHRVEDVRRKELRRHILASIANTCVEISVKRPQVVFGDRAGCSDCISVHSPAFGRSGIASKSLDCCPDQNDSRRLVASCGLRLHFTSDHQ